MSRTIFVTGGAGYVGSHTVIELLNAGYSVVVIDNFVNAIPAVKEDFPESLKRVQEITGKIIIFYQVDLLDKQALEAVFVKHDIYCVIHFAALKAVGESCVMPLSYYKNNIGGTIILLEVMKAHNVKKFIFSSSATVYGLPQYLPIDEKHPVGISLTNPYGKSKYFVEEILQDFSKAEPDWSIVILRYFNPVGAHFSGKIGEDPKGPPNNLMPYVAQVAIGRQEKLLIFGNDYDTVDGTGVRDYIHVVDLAIGHVASLSKLEDSKSCKIYNLGTGHGYSVLQMVEAFEKASGKKIPYKIDARRPGDVPSCYSDVTLAEKELNWKADKGLKEMCEDIWRWQSQNPKGFSH